jgi:hypothetical protein
MTDAPEKTHCDTRSAMPLHVPGLPTRSFIPFLVSVRPGGRRVESVGELEKLASGRCDISASFPAECSYFLGL